MQHVAARRLHLEAGGNGVAPCVDTSHPIVMSNRTGTFVAAAAITTSSIGQPGETLVLMPVEGEGEGEGSSTFGAADTGEHCGSLQVAAPQLSHELDDA